METLLGLTPVANISTLFRELPFLERPAAAMGAGYRYVECWWPWEQAPAPSDTKAEAFTRAITDSGVHLVGLNLFAGDLSGPDAGILSDPGDDTAFADALDAALGLGRTLGVSAFNTLYGNRLTAWSPEQQDDVATERLVTASARAAAQGAMLLIEPLSGDKPYPLRLPEDAIEVVDRVHAARGLPADARNSGIGWLCDLYHLAANGLTAEAAEETLTRFGPRAAHLQVADSPGRGAPGTGTIPLGRYVNLLKGTGYKGYLSLEFLTTQQGSTLDALASMAFAP